MEPLNTPYVKQFDEAGKLLNPINGSYLNTGKNRRERRFPLQKDIFRGNKKGISLSVTATDKHERVVQRVPIFKGLSNTIVGFNKVIHYVLRRNIGGCKIKK